MAKIERLSDDYIKQTVEGLQKRAGLRPERRLTLEAQLELAALVELQERRAADLGADELQWLRSFRDVMAKTPAPAHCVAILDKVLAAHGAEP